MTNYKPGHKIVWPGGEMSIPYHLIQLNDPTALATVADSARLKQVAYVVPVNHTFESKLIVVWTANVTGNLIIYEGLTEDATTTGKRTISLTAHPYGQPIFTVDDSSFAAERYITFVPGAASIRFIQMYGYEQPE